jgi:hypothetical protein
VFHDEPDDVQDLRGVKDGAFREMLFPETRFQTSDRLVAQETTRYLLLRFCDRFLVPLGEPEIRIHLAKQANRVLWVQVTDEGDEFIQIRRTVIHLPVFKPQ